MMRRLPPGVREVDGIRFRQTGPTDGTSAHTIVLLHGLGGSLHMWTEVQRRADPSWRTIAVDIPGFGDGVRGSWSFTVHRSADRLAGFLRQQRIADATLVSHSIGNVIAGLLASAMPDAFSRVVLVSGALHRAAAIAQNPLRGLASPRLAATVAAQFLAGMIPIHSAVRNLLATSRLARRIALWPFVADPAGLDGDRVATALTNCGSPAVLKILLTARSIDYVAIIESVRQPVGLLWGECDRLIGHEDISRMATAVDLAYRRSIAHCGHWPMIEDPSAVIEFLETWGKDAPTTHHEGR